MLTEVPVEAVSITLVEPILMEELEADTRLCVVLELVLIELVLTEPVVTGTMLGTDCVREDALMWSDDRVTVLKVTGTARPDWLVDEEEGELLGLMESSNEEARVASVKVDDGTLNADADAATLDDASDEVDGPLLVAGNDEVEAVPLLVPPETDGESIVVLAVVDDEEVVES